MTTFTRHGLTFRTTVEQDTDHGAPWEECDGHGPVTDWTSRDKMPGELVLNVDGRQRRYYDFAEACRIARRDGWDAPPYKTGTARQRAARAARADFEYLRAWCNDDWSYVGVIVELLDDEGEPVDRASLWGVESSDDAYIEEVAQELADELASTAAATLAKKAASLQALADRINQEAAE